MRDWETLAKMVMRRMYKTCRCQIHYKAEIGPDFTILHGDSIGIAQDVRIGKNFHVGHNVTIGGNWYRNNGEQQFPVIGDNVWIMTGAVVIGPVTIGSNVLIGANTVITRDVPDNVVVAARQGRVVRPLSNEDLSALCGDQSKLMQFTR